MIYDKPRAELFAQDAPESEIKPFTAWLRGLGIAFEETNGYPELESFNGLLQALNSYIKYLEQNGFAEWSADLEYPVGAGVRVGSVWYRAKTQNTNKPPATSQNDWELFLNAAALSYGNPIYIENNVIKVSDASTAQKGVVQFANATEVANKNNVSKAINPANAATIAQSTDLGVGQIWQNLTSIRATNTTYTNNTEKPIQILICADLNVGSLVLNGISLPIRDLDSYSFVNVVIPIGHTYRLNTSVVNSIVSWAELR